MLLGVNLSNNFQNVYKTKITVSYEKYLPKSEKFIEYDESDSWYFEKYGGKFETKSVEFTFEVDELNIQYNIDSEKEYDFYEGRPYVRYIPKRSKIIANLSINQ